MGKMPGRVLMAGGLDLGEEDVKESLLWVQGEGEGPELSSSEEEDWPGPPLEIVLFLCSADYGEKEFRDTSLWPRGLDLGFCFCFVLIHLFIPRYMRPRGPWQWLCRCP